MSEFFSRAFILIQQGRYDLAEQELRRRLNESPQDPTAHSLLAMALAFQGKPERYDEALSEAKEGVHLAPDSPFAHVTLARIHDRREELDAAERAVREAIRLDPHSEDHFGVLAHILLERRAWQDALEAADRGLAINAEDETCINARAMALNKLGRSEEAQRALGAALARNPENAYTHANHGWTCIHNADYKQAQEHFREALRLDPELDWARQGMIEALKARNPIYRVMLNYFLFMSRLSGRTQWIVIIGLYVAYRLASAAAQSMPQYRIILVPLIILYIAFAFLSWTAVPLFNLLLRLNRFGRYALTRDQVIASNCTGALLLFGIGGLGFALLADQMGRFDVAGAFAFLLGLWCLIMVIPVSGAFGIRPGRRRKLLAGYAMLLGLIGLAPVFIITLATTEEGARSATGLVSIFLIGVLLFGFVANALSMKE